MRLPPKLIGAAAGGAMALAWPIAHFYEGRVLHTYFDIAHVATICDGHTGSDVKPGMVKTDPQCDDLLTGDLQIAFYAEDAYLVAPEKLPPWTRAAAASFILNEGVEAFRTSTFRRLLNEGRVTEACDTLLWWDKARVGGGPLKIVAGLINRRESERHLCLGEPW